MNRDDIIRMAREAGYGEAMSDLHAPALERFAELVAAAIREEEEVIAGWINVEELCPGTLEALANLTIRK